MAPNTSNFTIKYLGGPFVIDDTEVFDPGRDPAVRFAEAHRDQLEELDVNPLMVLAPGKGAIAVDALIRLRERTIP